MTRKAKTCSKLVDRVKEQVATLRGQFFTEENL